MEQLGIIGIAGTLGPAFNALLEAVIGANIAFENLKASENNAEFIEQLKPLEIVNNYKFTEEEVKRNIELFRHKYEDPHLKPEAHFKEPKTKLPVRCTYRKINFVNHRRK